MTIFKIVPTETKRPLRQRPWSWPVAGTAIATLSGGGLTFMTSSHPLIADGFLVSAGMLFLMKFVWQEDTDRDRERRILTFVIGGILPLIVVAAAITASHYLNRQAKKPIEVATESAHSTAKQSELQLLHPAPESISPAPQNPPRRQQTAATPKASSKPHQSDLPSSYWQAPEPILRPLSREEMIIVSELLREYQQQYPESVRYGPSDLTFPLAFVDWLNKELWRRNYHFEVTLPPTSPVPGSEFVHVEGDAIVDIRDSEANGFEKGVVAKDNTRVTVGNLRLNAGRTRASLFTLRVVER